MGKLENLIKFQIERDMLNVLIQEQFEMIISADTTMEQKKKANEEHSKLIDEYLAVCKKFKEGNK